MKDVRDAIVDSLDHTSLKAGLEGSNETARNTKKIIVYII